MDIDYYSLVLINTTGGLECIFYTKPRDNEFEAITPWVQLFGSWIDHEKALRDLLSKIS